MKKILIPALLVLISGQALASELISQGSASTSLIVRATTGWSITKGEEGLTTLDDGVIREFDAVPSIVIRNDSPTAATYRLRGQGESKGEDGTVMFVKRNDHTKKFSVAHFAMSSGTVWSEDEALYRSESPLESGAEKTISLIPFENVKAEPGVYDVSVELLTETL